LAAVTLIQKFHGFRHDLSYSMFGTAESTFQMCVG
jgi:hypothetical protein